MKFILLSTLLYGCQSFNPKTTEQESIVNLGLDEDIYSERVMSFSHSKIRIFISSESALNSEKIIAAVKKVWPLFEKQFHYLPAEIKIIDSVGPIGGGPTKPYTVAIYSTKQFGPLYKTLVSRATGWQPEVNTKAYIEKYYSHFSDPEQAYIDDIIIHEIAHTIFGFGLTRAAEDYNDWWFTFGLGLIYDRMIWNKIYTTESPLFSSAVRRWKMHFSTIHNIDQRLVKPDTRLDDRYALSRLQVYGHGKALVYLSELRKLLGSDKFDQAVSDTIQEQGKLNYDEFIGKYFKDKMKIVSALEVKYQVR